MATTVSQTAPPSIPPARFAPERRPRRTISLTPLIDVVFILLVFFMLASNFFDWRAIELATPAAGSGGGAMEGAMLVEVRAEGLRLGGRVMPIDQVTSRLAERATGDRPLRVLVRPEAEVPLQRAVDVLEQLAVVDGISVSMIRRRGG